MKKHLFGAALTSCLMIFMLGAAVAQTIDEIQEYTAGGEPNSPYDGMTVTVEGLIYAVKGTYNNGTHYIQGATGGINFYDPGAPALDYGDRVSVTGTVTSFGGEINIDPTNVTYQGTEPEPTPTEVLLGDLMSPPDYEWVGNFIYVDGTVTNKGSNNFYLYVATDTIQVYIDSDTGIDLGAVDEGDSYRVISPCVVYNTELELKPRKQSDLIEDPGGDTVPVIDDVNCTNWCPEAGDPIEVTATITDDGTIVSTNLYYRDSDGSGTGVFTPVAMTNTGGDTYSGTIPPPHTERQVDFYVEATDDYPHTVTNPGDAPASWYEVAIGFTPIYDLQYAHPDSSNQSSAYDGVVLNIRGVVTAGTGYAGAASKFILQEPEPNPSPPHSYPAFAGEWDYRWGGVLVYEGTAANFVFEGDMVAVGGYGDEYYFLTEMAPHNGSAVYIESFGNDLPPPMYVRTRTLADDVFMDDGNGRFAEAFEGCWVRTQASVVMDTLGYGEYLISDTGARADSVEVDPSVTLTYSPIINDVVIIEGFMDYDYGDPQITPIGDGNVISGLVAVNDPLPRPMSSAGGFKSIQPNPFNPVTKLSFVLTRDSLTQLNIYDIRGQLVRSLVNDRLPAGDHTLTWDGTDLTGQHVASGTYFARLRIDTVMEVRKMSMIK